MSLCQYLALTPFAFAGALSWGVAFDGHGNLGSYRSGFVGGAGYGADISLTQGGMWSADARDIYELRGPFLEGSGTGGDELAVTGVGFSGDGRNGNIVHGSGVFVGAGAGAGLAAGVSNTKVDGINIFTGKINDYPRGVPAPGGTTYVDPSGCEAPDCITTERVTVTGAPVSQPSLIFPGQTYYGPGGPFHVGTTGNIIGGPVFTVTNLFPDLTSSGGGDWLPAGYSPGGGQPGEGFHPVSYNLY
jgi:hypothetical protein